MKSAGHAPQAEALLHVTLCCSTSRPPKMGAWPSSVPSGCLSYPSPPSNRNLGSSRVRDRCFSLLCLPRLALSQCILSVTRRDHTITHPIQEGSKCSLPRGCGQLTLGGDKRYVGGQVYPSTPQLAIMHSGWQRLAVEDLGDGGLPMCVFCVREWGFQATESHCHSYKEP